MKLLLLAVLLLVAPRTPEKFHFRPGFQDWLSGYQTNDCNYFSWYRQQRCVLRLNLKA